MSTLKDYNPRKGPDYIPTAFGRLRTARAKYVFANDGGAVGLITPLDNDTIPANSVMIGAFINSIVAPLSGGSATVAVGLSAGSTGAAALLAATAKASLTINLVTVGVPTPAVPVKTTAAGTITLTVATAALTAGTIEVVVLYYTASA